MPSSPTVGVIGLPEFADALRTIGFRVITDDSFRAAATAISRALSEGPFPVISSTLDEAGFEPWVKATPRKSEGLYLLRVNPQVTVPAVDGLTVLEPPVTVNDLLPLLGFASITDPLGDITVHAVAAPEPPPAAPSLLQPIAKATPPMPTPAPVQTPAVADDIFDVKQAVPPSLSPVQPVRVEREPEPAPAYVAPEVPAAPVAPPAYVVPAPAPEPYRAPQSVPAPQPAYTPVPPTPQPHYEPAPVTRETSYTDGLFAVPTPDTPYGRGQKAEVLAVLASKGGVTKTTTALMLAQAAGTAGLRVIVIDANRGQGNGVRTSLRLPETAPNILNAIRGGDPASVLMKPDEINGLRPRALRPVEFGVVLAPPRDSSAPELASGGEYARVLDAARAQADLVIIDTQEAEGHKTDVFNDMVLPALRGGAWGLFIATYDNLALKNLDDLLSEFARDGVPNAKQLLMAARWPDFDPGEQEQLERRYGGATSFVGVMAEDQNVADQKSLGNLYVTSPAVEPLVKSVLHRVTGNQAFEADPAGPRRKRRGLFGGRR